MEVQDDFQMDLEDPRFSSLLNNHEFFIDPTNPQFKKTKAMDQILDKKRKENLVKMESQVVPITETEQINNLVSSIKRKSSALKLKGKRQKL